MANTFLRHVLFYVAATAVIFWFLPLGFILGWVFAIAYPAAMGERALHSRGKKRQISR